MLRPSEKNGVENGVVFRKNEATQCYSLPALLRVLYICLILVPLTLVMFSYCLYL